MKFLHICVLLLCSASTAAPAGPILAQPQDDDASQWEAIQKRLTDKRNYGLYTSGMWALTHDYTSREELDKLMKVLLSGLSAQTPADRKKLGGAKGFKDSMASFLTSSDDTVAGFAATVLGIFGDPSYIPRIAKVLDRQGPAENSDRMSRRSSGGYAAVALSLLNAREYLPRFANMLKSRNHYDRSGATFAIARLGAKEYAKDIAALLNREEYSFPNDASPIFALVELGLTGEYAPGFVRMLGDSFGSETQEAAAFALAKLGTRYAGDVAKLLNQEFSKGAGAKALAIMGATEYTDQIALLLKDESGLVRNDALLALGILSATKYTTQIAEHLRDSKSSASNFAATALILMGAEEYAGEVTPLVESSYKNNLYLNADEFSPLVEEELKPLRKRFSESFLKMKAKGIN